MCYQGRCIFGERRGMYFFDFISREYPDFYQPLKALYQTGGAPKAYKNQLYQMVNELKEKYGLSGSYSKLMKEKLNQPQYTQMSLFDL